MRAGELARALCGQGGGGAYMPHLSLLYSDADPQARCGRCEGCSGGQDRVARPLLSARRGQPAGLHYRASPLASRAPHRPL
jgi:hypothetical protein